MGSYSCSNHLLPFVTWEDYERVFETPKATVEAMRREGTSYRGILYGQFILSGDGSVLIQLQHPFRRP